MSDAAQETKATINDNKTAFVLRNNSVPSQADKQLEAIRKLNQSGQLDEFTSLNSRLLIRQIGDTKVLVDFSTNKPVMAIPKIS